MDVGGLFWDVKLGQTLEPAVLRTSDWTTSLRFGGTGCLMEVFTKTIYVCEWMTWHMCICTSKANGYTRIGYLDHRRHKSARSPNRLTTLPCSSSMPFSQILPASTSGAPNLTTTHPRTEAADQSTRLRLSCRCLAARLADAGSTSSSPLSLPLSHFLPPMRGSCLNSFMNQFPSEDKSGP